MKRLRLRKIWVILAVLMLMTPLLSGRLEKSDATAPTDSSSPAETTTEPSYGGQFKIWIKVDQSGTGDVDFEDKDGLSQIRWNMKVPENSGFVSPNTGVLTAFISVDGSGPIDLASLCDKVKWEYIVETADADKVIQVREAGVTTDTQKTLQITPNAAGLISVYITARGYNEDPTGTEDPFSDGKKYTSSGLRVQRRIIIGSPLQIYSDMTAAPNQYVQLKADGTGSAESLLLPDTTEIYANNADVSTCNIAWFYVDAETNQEVRLERPYGLGDSDPDIPMDLTAHSVSNIIAPIGNKGALQTTASGVSVFPYKLTSVGKAKGGFVRLIGRIYLDGKSTSDIYIEKVFDVMVAAGIEDSKLVSPLKYGDTYLYKNFSNDAGHSLEWKAYTDYPNVVEKNGGVLKLTRDGITANNYGEVTLEALAFYNDYENYNLLRPSIRDIIKVKVDSTVLKGISDKQIVSNGSLEVISVGGTITLSTNVIRDGSHNYHYKWYYDDGSTAMEELTADDGGFANSLFKSEGVAKTPDGSEYSSIKITGLKSGEDIPIVCRVYTTNEADPVLNSRFTIRITDTMSLSESKITVAEGKTYAISVYSSVNNGKAVEWSIPEEWKEYVSVASSGDKSAVITGILSTDGQYVPVTATQEINGTTVSAVCQVKVIPGINGAEIIAEPSSTISVGGLAELTLKLDSTGTNFTEDEIKWVLKDKTGPAKEIINLKENPGNILKTSVTGLSPGEAYVAVVTNDSSQTEIAVITIKVVSEVQGLKLSENEVTGYLPEKTHQLTYKLQPEGFVSDELGVEWSSNNENIATVDQNGLVTYVGIGTVRITAQVAGMPAISDTCTFVIENPATGLELDPVSKNLKVGDSFTISATVTPEDVTNASLSWTSSDTKVATVDRYGVVKAVGAGGAVITCTTSNGLTATCVVTVLKPVESITLNYDNITVKKGTIFYLSAQVNPIDAYDKSVTYSSSDESIVTVDQDGTVTAVKVGTAEITVTSKDNPEVSAVCVVSVTESVSGITLNVKEKTIDVGEQFQLIATVRPSDSLNRNVTWTSSDPTIASVDENGLVTGIKGGKVIIMAKTEERGLMASCTITVQQDIEQIILSDTELYVGKGKTKKINYTLVPETATKKKLIWKSSNEGIAIVDADGNVHGVNLGTTTITATSQDDGKVKVTCKVTVINEAQTVTLNQTIIRIMEGEKYDLTATISPAGASVQKITWSTSDAAVARVDSMGRVTAVREGECTVRAAAADGGGAYGECRVIVTAAIPTTSVTVDSTETTMVVGDTRTMTARVLPRNTTESIRWVSGDTSVVTIDNNGNMKAVGPGVCKVTAISSSSGIEGVSTVTVLGLNAMSITLEQYDSFDLYLDGVPNGITWFSRNKRVASVTRGGVVTARMPGTTNVVARVNGKLVSCEITVEKIKK